MFERAYFRILNRNEGIDATKYGNICIICCFVAFFFAAIYTLLGETLVKQKSARLIELTFSMSVVK